MSKIPQQIHFFWFGNNPRNKLFERCLKSWKTNLPEYSITEWNEANYDVNKNNFTQRAFREQKWAFLSDYARLDVLYRQGGIYLDTDMEIVKSLDRFLDKDLFIGMESDKHVNASILGCTPRHWLLKEILEEYEKMTEYKSIPIVVTNVLKRYITIDNSKIQTYQNINVYPSRFFYPFAFGEKISPEQIGDDTYGIHWWNYTWGSWRSRLLKKLGLFKIAVRIKNKISPS